VISEQKGGGAGNGGPKENHFFFIKNTSLQKMTFLGLKIKKKLGQKGNMKEGEFCFIFRCSHVKV